MKNPWFFRVYTGLYYPVMWGLNQTSKRISYQTTRIQWKVFRLFFSFLKCLLVVDFGNVASKNPVLMDLMESKSELKIDYPMVFVVIPRFFL